ncbi:MAG: magnesium transporter [Candidatus Puniceispirillaceae bacterium]
MTDSNDVHPQLVEPDQMSVPAKSLYGLTPKVEDAIMEAVSLGDEGRVRALTAPLHSADMADLLGRVSPKKCGNLLRLLGDQLDSEAIAYLDDEVLEQVLDIMGPAAIAKALPELESDDVVTIVEELEPEERDEVLKNLSAQDRVIVEQGLSYPDDSAGRMMQREMIMLPPYWTVGQTIDHLRSLDSADNQSFYLIMVVDAHFHPVGEINVGRLLRANRPVRLSEIMNVDFRSVPVHMDQEEVAMLFRRYGMVTTSVVDEDGRLVGVITLDDIVDVIDEEAEEDLMALAGVSDASIRSSLLETFQGRASWLFVNLLTAVLASLVIGLFESTLEQVVALAVLMPIVASMGGNAGTQTVTVAVRAIAMQEFSNQSAARFALRELLVGAVNGILFAFIAGAVSYLWFGDMMIALILGGAMVINLVIAGLTGTLVPLSLVRFGIDPAVASSVFITTITDVVGFFVFLGLAAFFLL